jgi:hypothetical protein
VSFDHLKNSLQDANKDVQCTYHKILIKYKENQNRSVVCGGSIAKKSAKY